MFRRTVNGNIGIILIPNYLNIFYYILNVSEDLEKLKKIVEFHMTNQITIISLLNSIPLDEVKEFNKWYKQHPYYHLVTNILYNK